MGQAQLFGQRWQGFGKRSDPGLGLFDTKNGGQGAVGRGKDQIHARQDDTRDVSAHQAGADLVPTQNFGAFKRQFGMASAALKGDLRSGLASQGGAFIRPRGKG